LPEPLFPEAWPDRQVALLGQLIGDGSYLSGQPLRYTTSSEANSETVAEAAREEFGCEVKRYAGRRSWHQLLISGNGDRWHPRGVGGWLRRLGVFGQRGHDKRIPEAAFRLPDRQIALLLRHLWATDGTIAVHHGNRGSDGVFYSTTSGGLAADVAALLLRLGIVARIGTATKAGYRPSSAVCVSGTGDQRRFLDVVGAFGPREPQSGRLECRLAGRQGNTNVELRSAAASDLFWDRIVAIEPAGDDDVFDLTVPGPASWLADGIVSHNSGALEQDADVIMFLHRPSFYSKDPMEEEARKTAEVHVGKQRNGPTGKLEVAFLSQYARFENLAGGDRQHEPF
jgi:replicative DNA helicase